MFVQDEPQNNLRPRAEGNSVCMACCLARILFTENLKNPAHKWNKSVKS